MDFFLEPFWYVEYEKIHFQYYSRLEEFKNSGDEFSDEERKKESMELNILHNILNKIRSQYNSYFCSNYKDFENLFDFQVKRNKFHQFPIIILNENLEEEEEYPIETNLIVL